MLENRADITAKDIRINRDRATRVGHGKRGEGASTPAKGRKPALRSFTAC
jgi:hypothetical protein